MKNLKKMFETLEKAVEYLFEEQDQEFANDSGYIANTHKGIAELLKAGQDIHTTSGERYYFQWK